MKIKNEKTSILPENLALSVWWPIVFIATCSVCYLHAIYWKEVSYQEVLGKIHQLENEKVLILQQQQELRDQINSQSDPAWVEMVLKRNLGLVPIDQVKVYFKEDS